MASEDDALALGRDGHHDAKREHEGGEVLRDLERLARVPLALSDSLRRDRSHPDLRLALTSRIDDETRALVRAVVFAGLPDAVAREAVRAARDAFGALLDAYQSCAASYRSGEGGRPAIEPDACGYRLVRAAADRIKWERCAGGPAHAQLWHWIANEFRKLANSGSRAPIFGMGKSAHTTGSVAREYLRAVALSTASLDRLPCEIVEAVDGLVVFSLPMIQFQPGGVTGAIYFSPPDFAAPPRRIVRADDVGPAAWHFSPRVALKALEELALRPDGDAVLVRFAEENGGTTVLRRALCCLVQRWGDAAPTRRFRRHLLDGTLSAVRGIDELRRLFSGEGKARWSEWTFRDASRGGMGVYAPLHSDPPVRVGELVGVRSVEGDALQLAVVRRAWIETEASSFIGLETLSQKPALVSADDGRSRTSVFLCDPMQRGETVRVLVPPRALCPGVPLFVTGGGIVQKLKSLNIGMSGEGFELLVYRVL